MAAPVVPAAPRLRQIDKEDVVADAFWAVGAHGWSAFQFVHLLSVGLAFAGYAEERGLRFVAAGFLGVVFYTLAGWAEDPVTKFALMMGVRVAAAGFK